ncbi:hypothetical protein N657DRAFT_437214 [Parathielavia appendiculata]|uniref:Uncharacterized protein n=1 Tax=Parathielavia appendiculata TaxID=2587402 RepID=A0AAN6U062_9PEZI|nr:hypothetical protein N657DRAFT_437214 [Parathielavia appendiculata]
MDTRHSLIYYAAESEHRVEEPLMEIILLTEAFRLDGSSITRATWKTKSVEETCNGYRDEVMKRVEWLTYTINSATCLHIRLLQDSRTSIRRSFNKDIPSKHGLTGADKGCEEKWFGQPDMQQTSSHRFRRKFLGSPVLPRHRLTVELGLAR